MRMIHICIKRTEKKKKIISFYKATNRRQGSKHLEKNQQENMPHKMF